VKGQLEHTIVSVIVELRVSCGAGDRVGLIAAGTSNEGTDASSINSTVAVHLCESLIEVIVPLHDNVCPGTYEHIPNCGLVSSRAMLSQ